MSRHIAFAFVCLSGAVAIASQAKQPSEHARTPLPDALVRQLVKDNDDVATHGPSIDELSRTLPWKRVDLNGDGRPEYMLEATVEMGYCGASGHCSWWIYSDTGTGFVRIYPDPDEPPEYSAGSVEDLEELGIGPGRTNGFADLSLTANQGTVANPDVEHYLLRYNGHYYRTWRGSKKAP